MTENAKNLNELPFGISIGKLMHDIFKYLKAPIEESLPDKLSVHHIGLLFAIRNSTLEVTQKDIAAKLGKDDSAILRWIDTLEEKKIVERKPFQDDRRKNQLIITEKGNHIIEEFYRIENELFKNLFEGLEDSELKTFYKVINKIKYNAQNLNK